MTDWEEFKHLPWRDLGRRVRNRTVLDARNLLDRQQLEEAGFTYIGTGRSLGAQRSRVAAGITARSSRGDSGDNTWPLS